MVLYFLKNHAYFHAIFLKITLNIQNKYATLYNSIKLGYERAENATATPKNKLQTTHKIELFKKVKNIKRGEGSVDLIGELLHLYRWLHFIVVVVVVLHNVLIS